MGTDDELDPSLSGGSNSERPDLRIGLPIVEAQREIIAEAEDEKSSAFVISQEDIDTVLTRGSGIHEGKYRIYEQFLKRDSSENNIAFLKDEYGVGGAYPAVSSSNLDESHDAKGIKISRGRISQPDAELLLRWNKVEKRIGELIRADRYLSQAEKDSYPAYREQSEARRKRGEISEEFRSIVYDYNDFVTQLGEESKALNLYYLSSCWSAFSVGDKKMHARTAEGDFILPMMREAMNTIMADNTHLTARCEAMLKALNSDVAKPLEPTYDELNPPPEPRKEYRYHLGDMVYIGTQEYELLSFDEKKVVLFDTQFPLFNKELPREEFDNRLKENPLNDRLLQTAEDTPATNNEEMDQGAREAEHGADAARTLHETEAEEDGTSLAPPPQTKRLSKAMPHVLHPEINTEYGALRGTVGNYKGELTGSDKHFSFSLNGNPDTDHVHVFESAIDLLSFATLELLEGRDWKVETLLSLAGVFQTKREGVVPVALTQFLNEHPSVCQIRLHLDNDAVGRCAAKGITSGLQGKYQVYDEPPPCGKDVNDELRARIGHMRKRKEPERT